MAGQQKKVYPQDFSEEAQLLIQEDETLIEGVIAAEDKDFVGVVGRLAPRLPTPLQQLQRLLPAEIKKHQGFSRLLDGGKCEYCQHA